MLDLGPFRLDHPAGRGATATVWRATHRARGTPVAVKILTAADAAPHQLAREIRAVARLDHPAIIRVHDHGQLPPGLVPPTPDPAARLPTGAPYIVMDWHARGTLVEHAGRLPWPALDATLTVLLDALAHAHARGVIHRDLKPANVLLGDRGPVVSDFGLVFAADTATDREGRASGTPNYMAPEQVRHDWRRFGPATDLYALGCLAWTLATGRAPFAGRGVRGVMQSHLTGELPIFQPIHPVPDGFIRWLGRLLHKHPDARYRFAADAAAALRALPPPPDDALGPTTITTPPRDPSSEILLDDDDPTLYAPPTLAALTAAPPGPRTDDRPPLPPEYHRPDPPWAPHLPGCGRALAELREMRLRGRDRERARLWKMLADAVDGRPRAALIQGPDGLGKTRLMHWIARRAHELGQADTLTATHAPAPGPGHGVLPLFTRHLRLDGLTPAAAAARIRDALAADPLLATAIAALDRPDRTADLDLPNGDTHRITLRGENEIITTLLDGLTALAARRPLVIQLDDAQWGDRALRLVTAALDRPHLPALFVLTLRPDAAPRPIRPLIDQLAAHPAAERLELWPLDPAVHADAATARLPLTDPTRDRLVALTRGNPLFATELLRHWLHTDALTETPDGFHLTDAALLPPDLGALMRARLDSLLTDLTPDPRPALERAAALGLVIDPPEWRAALAIDRTPYPTDALERLLDAGLVTPATADPDHPRYTLTRPTADALLTAAPPHRLTAHHRACAQALTPADPYRRALHHTAAGDHPAAHPHYRAALQAAEDAWGTITPATLPILTDALRSARHHLTLDHPHWIELTISYSAWLNTRRRGLGLRHARHALDRIRRHPQTAPATLSLHARALRHLARCHRDHGDHTTADVRLAESEDLALAAGDTASLCATRRLRATLAYLRGDLDTAESLLRAVLNRLPHAPPGPNTRFQSVEAHNQLGEIHRRRGDLPAAAREYTAALAILGDDDTWLPALIQLNLALIDLTHDDIPTAEARAQTARTRLIRAGAARYRIYAEAVLLACAAHRADPTAWDRAWTGLGPATTLDFIYLDVARLIDRAATAAARTLPTRAARAADVARRQYAALGQAPSK